VRDVIFSPAEERTEEMIGRPLLTLKNLKLTDEDFADIRNIQPFVLVEELLPIYETKFRGEENIDDVDCYVLQVRPRQVLSGQRLFDGMLWVKKDDFAIVRSEGQAVPQMRSMKQENLFPRFTTVRHPIDGKHWFPVYTHADDTLAFRTGPQRIKLMIRYSNYKKFGSESSIQFGK
jgi:hypothetical protein